VRGRGRGRSTLALALGLGLALGCATTGDTLSGEPGPAAPGQTEEKHDDAWAKRKMTELERRLVAATKVEIAFEIQSEGAVASQLSGTLSWTRDGELHLVATGEFAGEAQDLELRADAESLEALVAGEARHTGARPAQLVEAIVLSFTRQGLLHNLALLTAGLPPEHGDGGIDEWLRYVEPQLGPPEVFGAGEATPLEFQIEVADQHVGHATLWLRDDVPLERRQTVEFPDGQMEVVERYTSFSVE
jgi:hypothetical protein